MSRYDVKGECDLEAQREVRLTSFSRSLEDSLRNNNPNGSTTLPHELESRLANGDHFKKRDGQPNGSVPYVERNESLCSKCGSWLQQRLKSTCKRKMMYKRIPILHWLPKYRMEYIVPDMVAGLTVGLTVIPQAIAYANVAGLPPQYGLYSSFMACFIYTIFGSCKDVPIGPTAVLAILTRETLQKYHLGPDFAVLLAFISGCVCLLMGLLQLGFLMDFISGPVSVGFTSAAAIIIATSQAKDMLGLNVGGGKFIESWQTIFEHISETRLWDVVLGVICMIVLLILRKIKDLRVVPKDAKSPTFLQKIILKFLWLLSSARNIFVVLTAAVICWLLERHYKSSPVILTGHVKPGLPVFHLPPFSAKVGNETYNFIDMASVMGSGCIIVPFISLLETIAIAKAFNDGSPIDATQEMVAVGACNILSSFVTSIPVCGALSRGAVNYSSGVKTTFGGVYTGVLVLLSLQFLTPYLYYIPKASLAAVIIAAVVFMVEIHVVKPMWRTKKADLIPAVVTFGCCLFLSLELGMVIGIGVNLLFLLYASARPSLRVQKAKSIGGYDYLAITPDRSLSFPSVEYVRAVISKHGTKQGTAVPIVIDSAHIQAADFTVAKGIKCLIEDFARRGQPLIFYNLKPSVVNIFRGVNPLELRCCFSEVELNDYLKDFTNVSGNTVSRH